MHGNTFEWCRDWYHLTLPGGVDRFVLGEELGIEKRTWRCVTGASRRVLAVLGTAVGVSISNRVNPENLETAVLVWSIVITCAALFVGGLVTSQFTVGDNKMEAMLYGVIMWAVLFVVLLGLGAAGGARSNAMVSMAELAQAASAESWDRAARRTDIVHPAEEPTKKDATATPPAASIQTAKRIAWFAFAGTWLSMFAAAFGALVGAGPTFRLATVAVTAPHIIR